MRTGIMRRIFPLGALLLFSSVAFSTTSNIYTFPGPDVDLGQDYVNRAVSGEHYIGGRGDTIYVLRQSVNTFCHKSTDGGRTFGPGVQVNSIPRAVNASLHVDTSGVVYVAYQADEDIYFTKSMDAGQTFTPGVKVNDDTISQTGQERPVIAVNDKGQIFIAWRDQRDLPLPNAYIWTLFSSASFNGGASFIPNVRISESSSPLLGGYDIGADDFGRVYAVWEPYTGTNKRPILLARSDDSGLTFNMKSVVTDLPTDISAAGGFSPSMAVESNVVGVAWEDSRFGQYSLRFSNSSDFGQTFSPSVVVDTSGSPQYPSLVWINGIFYVAWGATHRLTPTGPNWYHMWFSYSPDGGKSFVPYVDAVPDDTNFVPPARTGANLLCRTWMPSRTIPISFRTSAQPPG